MKTGRELDALVAEKVMGFKVGRFAHGDLLEIINTNCDFLPIPAYSSDIAAAWEVVEKLDKNWWVRIQKEWIPEPQHWHVYLMPEGRGDGTETDNVSAHATTAPHAICLAALEAVGVEV